MAREDLIPLNKRTKDEQKKITQKGGKKSGETRRKNKSMKQVFSLIKNLPVQDDKLKKQLNAVGITDEDTKYSAALAWSTIYHAMKGNSQMMRLAFEMMGEDPALKIKQEELNLKKKLSQINEGKGEVDAVQIYLPNNGRD